MIAAKHLITAAHKGDRAQFTPTGITAWMLLGGGYDLIGYIYSFSNHGDVVLIH